jgi:hypothetical protein
MLMNFSSTQVRRSPGGRPAQSQCNTAHAAGPEAAAYAAIDAGYPERLTWAPAAIAAKWSHREK